MTDARTLAKAHDEGSDLLLEENELRTGILIFNATSTVLYVLFSNKGQEASERSFSLSLAAQQSWDSRGFSDFYTGKVLYKLDSATSGFVMVTEFIKRS